MRTPVVLQVLLAGTALAVPQYDAGDHAHRVKRAAAVTTEVLASAVGTGEAIAQPSVTAAGARSGGKAGSRVIPRMLEAELAPAPPAPSPHRVVMQRGFQLTSVGASAGGFATASASPEHVKAGAGGAGSSKSIVISPRENDDIEIEEELQELPIPHRVEERQIKSVTLSLNAASTATVSAAPLAVLASGSGRGVAKSTTNGGAPTRRMAALPELEGLQRTASGALSMALMNDVDLDLFQETVDTVKEHADNLQGVIRTYSQAAEASQNLEEVTKAIDAKQLTADVAAPLTQINDALYTGISRMVMSSQRRKRGHGISGLQNIVVSYGLTSQLIELIVLIISLVAGLLGDTTGTSTGTITGISSLLAALLSGLLGSSENLLTPGSSSGSGVDLIATLLNSMLGLTNGFVSIDGVTNTLTPVFGF